MLYKLIFPKKYLILDIRSIPVENMNLVGAAYDLYFKLALHLKFYDALSTISQGMLEVLRHKYRLKNNIPAVVWGSGFDHRVFVCPDSVNCQSGYAELNGKFVVMFHGSLSPSRGLQEAVLSIRRLLDQGMSDLVLAFIGNGTAKRSLLEMVKSQGLEDQVLFYDPLPHEDIPAMVAYASLGIDPLPDHPWWRNQSSLKVYEYLAMGKPVIATNIPCHQDISRAVLLTPDHSAREIAEAILRYRNLSTQEKDQLRETALRDAQQYTWQARASTLARFIKDELLREPREPDSQEINHRA